MVHLKVLICMGKRVMVRPGPAGAGYISGSVTSPPPMMLYVVVGAAVRGIVPGRMSSSALVMLNPEKRPARLTVAGWDRAASSPAANMCATRSSSVLGPCACTVTRCRLAGRLAVRPE